MSASAAEEQTNQSVAERIVHASLAVGVAHLCFKLVGFVQAIVVGRYLGDKAFDAIYVFAFEGIIWSIFFRLGEETIGPCFLPVFMEQKDLKGEKAAWHLTNTVFTVQLLLLIAAVLGIMLFPDQLIQLGTAWSQKKTPDEYALARETLIWIAPCLIGLSLGSTTYMILNGYKKFFLAAFGEASWKICLLIALIVGIGWLGLGYRAVMIGLLIGGFAKLATHLCGLLKQIRFIRPSFDVKSPAFRALLWLMLPMLIGTLFSIVRDYFNNVYVLSTIDMAGLMKANSFGRKLFLAISWMVPYTVGIAMFPYFCEMVDRKDKQRLGWAIDHSCRLLCAVFIPLSFILAALSQPIALALFVGGKFTVQTATWAALSNACYILALPAYSLEYIFMQGYFANRKMVAVIIIGIAYSSLSVVVSYICIVVLGMTDTQALIAVALGYTVTRMMKTATLAIVLKRAVPMLAARETTLFLLRCVIVGLVAAGATWLVSSGYENLSASGTGILDRALGFLGDHRLRVLQLGQVAVAGTIGGGVFLGASWVVRLEEPFTMVKWTYEKVAAKLLGRKGQAAA